MIVAQTNEQVDDLIERLGDGSRRSCAVGRLSRGRLPARPTGVRRASERAASAQGRATWAGRAVIIGTAAKWATVTEAPGRGRSSTRRTRCARTPCCASRRRFDRALFVGDPGPARPVLRRSSRPLDAACRWDPMQSAVAVLLRAQPGPAGAPAAGVLAAAGLGGAGGRRGVLPVHRVPRPAPARATGALAFDASASATGRRRGARRGGRHRLGPATNCRPGFTVRTDAEAVAAVRRAGAARVLERGAVAALRARDAAAADRGPDRDRRGPPRPGRGASARALPPARPASPSTRPTACRAASTT